MRFFLFATLLFSASLLAQDTGSFYGTVTDPARAEAFSLFNTPIFKNPGNALGSLSKITSTSGGDRQLQFALKLIF